MNQELIQDIAKLCHVNEKEIAHLSFSDLMLEYILWKIVQPAIKDHRGLYISSAFMAFMAKWGKVLVEENSNLGELLMEIAMQRLECGAIIREINDTDFLDEVSSIQNQEAEEKLIVQHLEETWAVLNAAYYPLYALPIGYRKYSAFSDQPGLMDQECWNFCRENLYFCMTDMKNLIWRGHAWKLCVGLLQYISSDGEPLNGYTWNEALVQDPLRDVYNFAEKTACDVLGIQIVAQILLPTWRNHKKFYQKYELKIRFHTLLLNWQGLEEEGEHYYGKNSWRVKFLKLFGLYHSRVMNQIKKEMLNR